MYNLVFFSWNQKKTYEHLYDLFLNFIYGYTLIDYFVYNNVPSHFIVIGNLWMLIKSTELSMLPSSKKEVF